MTAPTCSTCLFYEDGTTAAFKAAQGFCRRYAPQGPVIGCDATGWQVFPPMMSHQWCGDYRPDPHVVTPNASAAA